MSELRAPEMPWLAPYITLRDVEASIRFYTEIFGFELADKVDGPDGTPFHIEFRYHGEKVLMGTPDRPETGQCPATLGVRAGQWFYLYVDDVDDVMARAVAAGAAVERAAEDAVWGDRMGILVCPNGYRWSVARWRGAAAG